jgi:hypothetical protein
MSLSVYKNRWLALWYDGNDNHISVLDFGGDASWGPFGNEDRIKEALWNFRASLRDGPDYEPRPDEIILNGLIYAPGDMDYRAILDDKEVDEFDIIEVLPE